jgi:hypothetical protein
MNKLIKSLFNSSNVEVAEVVDTEKDTHEYKFAEMVIKLLKNEPEQFSAMWFNNNVMETSVKHKTNGIHIYQDGHIISPIRYDMNKAQQKEIAELIAPLFNRDSDAIINSYLEKDT